MSGSMSTRLARNWWAVGIRGIAAVLFGVTILAMPAPTTASLVLLFAAYIAADGVMAIVAGMRAAPRGERWRSLILEGTTNLAVAGTVLVWHTVALVPFLRLAGAWGVITGAMMLAAARRLASGYGRRILTLAGTLSAGWGILIETFGSPADDDAQTMAAWLLAYAVVFSIALLALALRLRGRRHGSSDDVVGLEKRPVM
jgi:uncharacterized membrane protein HdeD (DUF308 family)